MTLRTLQNYLNFYHPCVKIVSLNIALPGWNQFIIQPSTNIRYVRVAADVNSCKISSAISQRSSAIPNDLGRSDWQDWRTKSRKREREREIHWSIQPALAYEDSSWLESSAKMRMARSPLVPVPHKTLHGTISKQCPGLAQSAAVCMQLHAWTRARPRIQMLRVQDGLLLHLKASSGSSGHTSTSASASNGLALFCHAQQST